MIITPKLTAWLPFEGNVNDASGNMRNGTLIGALLASGKFGQCYSFDGTSAKKIYFPHGLTINSSDYTIAFWANHGASNMAFATALGCGAYISPNVTGISFRFNNATGSFTVAFGSSASSGSFSLGKGLTGWNHYAFTYNTTTKACRAYLNGKLVHSVTRTIVFTASTTLLYVGYNPGLNTSTSYYNGLVDDVQCYNVVLKESDIRRIMLGLHPISI